MSWWLWLILAGLALMALGCLTHLVWSLLNEVDRYREALEQIRDGILSGNQAAEWAAQALGGSNITQADLDRGEELAEEHGW